MSDLPVLRILPEKVLGHGTIRQGDQARFVRCQCHALDQNAQVANELTAHDALAAHLSAELNIDELEVANPWHAALASAAAFAAGAVLPLLAILLFPADIRILATFIAVLIALAITGALSAHAGGSSRRRAVIRLILGGALAMGFTYLVGSLLGATGIA